MDSGKVQSNLSREVGRNKSIFLIRQILDSILRGVLALLIVIMHLCEGTSPPFKYMV